MESSWHRKVSGSGPVLSALEDEAAVERSLLRKQRAPVREFGSGPTSSALQRTKAIVQECRFLSERIVGQERPLHFAPVAQLDRYHGRTSCARCVVKAQRLRQAAEKAADEVFKAHCGEEHFLIGLALYWAEGSKSRFVFSNTSPEMIKFFVDWCMRYFSDKELVFEVKFPPSADQERLVEYWHGVTGLRACAGGKSVNTRSPMGVCQLRINGLYGNTHFMRRLIENFVAHLGRKH